MSDLKMISANVDPTVKIWEEAKYHIVVRLTKTNYNPQDPRIQNTHEHLSTFTIKEFEDMEKNRMGKHPLNWVNVSGYDKATIVHDGRLEKKVEVVKTGDQLLDEEQQKLIRDEVKKAAAKEKKKAVALKNFQNNAR